LPEVSDWLNVAGRQSCDSQDQQRYAEAERLYRRALAIEERTFGENHPDVATLTNNLGNLYLYQKKYAHAEPLLLRAFSIREKLLGPDHPAVANVLHNLARLHFLEVRYGEGRAAFPPGDGDPGEKPGAESS
jgi:tetratricopeptide (TPR) repeat protein